ncbi:hypothetical protein BKA69DRAFT_916435 [Paraphysoderma sedebokerense]|nr:hypothetical protein BKA69DRAFT_916435 [Paraphysoderma sedebokerense]
MIAVLTKRNKELTKEKRKLEHLLHAKSLQLESEAKKSQKIISETEAMKAKIAREKTTKELELTEALKKKLALEEKIREYEKRIDEEAKIRITLEHQNYTLRQKVEKMNFNEALGTFLDEPDSTTRQPDKTKGVPDEKMLPVPTSMTKKPKPTMANLSIPSPDEDKKIKVARVTLEYDAWVASKKIENKPKDKDEPHRTFTDEQPSKMEGSLPPHRPSTKPDDLTAHTRAASNSNSVPAGHKNTNPSKVRSPSPVGIETYSQKHDESNITCTKNGNEETPEKHINSGSLHPDEAVPNHVQ